jgi:hypothetical protein
MAINLKVLKLPGRLRENVHDGWHRQLLHTDETTWEDTPTPTPNSFPASVSFVVRPGPPWVAIRSAVVPEPMLLLREITTIESKDGIGSPPFESPSSSSPKSSCSRLIVVVVEIVVVVNTYFFRTGGVQREN